MAYLKCLVCGVLIVWASHALGACPTPNPNINAPPFVDGCPLPAAPLNNLSSSLNNLSSRLSQLQSTAVIFTNGLTPNIVSGTLSGTVTAGNVPGDPFPIAAFSGVSVTADTMTNTLPNSGTAAWSVTHSFGGPGAGEGNRMGIWSNLEQVGPVPLGTGLHQFDTSIFANVVGRFNLGGVDSPRTYVGSLFGFAVQADSEPGYTDTVSMVGGEIDINNKSTSTLIVEGLGIGSVPLESGNPSQHGISDDQALGIWAGGSCGHGSGAGGSGCIGFNVGISFGRGDSYFPIANNGTVIRANFGAGGAGSPKAFRGVDLSEVTFTECAWRSLGACIDGNGNLTINNAGTNIVLNDFNIGAMRLISRTGPPANFAMEVDTAGNGSFSSFYVPISWSGTGVSLFDKVFLDNLPTVAPGGGDHALCLDSGNRVFVSTGATC